MTAKAPPVGINLTDVPFPAAIGVWGVCPGDGMIAAVIRHATESWAGHAVMYVGGGQIVEATWPKVEISMAPTQNIIWATGQPLNAGEQLLASNKARSLVGTQYDIWVYPFLAAAVFDAALTKDVSHLFNNDRWWDCSGLIEECDVVANAPMFPGSSGSAHFVTPAMLMTLGAQEGWFTGQ
jgi:hypothetical protein